MERKNNQLTFLGNVTRDLGGKRTAALSEPLKDMYDNTTSKGGASNWPVIMDFAGTGWTLRYMRWPITSRGVLVCRRRLPNGTGLRRA